MPPEKTVPRRMLFRARRNIDAEKLSVNGRAAREILLMTIGIIKNPILHFIQDIFESKKGRLSFQAATDKAAMMLSPSER